jgi:3-oxoadipate CoA-transferase alpha subunit
MVNKIWDSFESAIDDIRDGATIMMFNWIITGCCCNLIKALYKKGSKDLTIITPNFTPGNIGDHILPQDEYPTPFLLAHQVKKVITAWPGTAHFKITSPLEEYYKEGKVEIEVTSHGNLVERIRAGGSGIGGFYSPIGVDTILEQGKEKRTIDGKEYILEKPLKADFGFVRAHKADKTGNLVYQYTQRGCNPIIAMASDTTIAEVEEIVEVGELDPNEIVTQGVFVDRIVVVPEGSVGSTQSRNNLIRKYLGGNQ